MERRRLGSTSLEVTPLGLGLAALGRPAYITLGRDEDLGSDRSVATLKRRSFQVLDAARDAGVSYFDAARSYGRAEEFLAAWLQEREIPDDSVTVGSKWGYTYVGEWSLDAAKHEIKDHSLPALKRQFGESKALLDDRMSLYQVHSATLESGILDDASVLEELLRLSDTGLVMGLSVSGPRQAEVVEAALEVDAGGRNPFSTVQATWNALEPSASKALRAAHDRGWGVIIKEGVANGRLTDRAEGPQRSVLETMARRHSTGIDAIALAFVLAQEWVDVALSGAVTVDQLHSNLAASEISLAADELRELDELAEPPEAYWEKRGHLSWS